MWWSWGPDYTIQISASCGKDCTATRIMDVNGNPILLYYPDAQSKNYNGWKISYSDSIRDNECRANEIDYDDSQLVYKPDQCPDEELRYKLELLRLSPNNSYTAALYLDLRDENYPYKIYATSYSGRTRLVYQSPGMVTDWQWAEDWEENLFIEVKSYCGEGCINLELVSVDEHFFSTPVPSTINLNNCIESTIGSSGLKLIFGDYRNKVF